jgi:hypothetical protein
MQTATSVKAGAAFLAGVLVALGGAVIYFKATDSRLLAPVQVAVIPSESAVPDMTAPPPEPTVSPKDAQPKNAAKDLPPQPPLHRKPVYAKPRTTSRPVSLAASHHKTEPQSEAVVQELPPPADAEPALTPPVEQTAPPPPIQAPQPHVVTIPAGTSLAVRLTEKLSTDHNFSGDTFRAALDAPIVMDGFIIADRGAKVLGRIVKAQKPGKFDGMAELSLTLTEISTTDGQQMRVETNESLRKGQSNSNEEVLKMGGGAVLGAIIGALAGGGKGAAIGAGAGGAAGTGAVLMGHGKPAVIANETRLTFSMAEPTTITERLN